MPHVLGQTSLMFTPFIAAPELQALAYVSQTPDLSMQVMLSYSSIFRNKNKK